MGHLDDVDSGAARERDGCEFEADKACDDDDNRARLLQPLPQVIRVS